MHVSRRRVCTIQATPEKHHDASAGPNTDLMVRQKNTALHKHSHTQKKYSNSQQVQTKRWEDMTQNMATHSSRTVKVIPLLNTPGKSVAAEWEMMGPKRGSEHELWKQQQFCWKTAARQTKVCRVFESLTFCLVWVQTKINYSTFENVYCEIWLCKSNVWREISISPINSLFVTHTTEFGHKYVF